LKAYLGFLFPHFIFLLFCLLFFAVYDLYCFTRVKVNIGLYLKVIAYLNISYCLLSVGLAFYHSIAFFGWAYIFLEISIMIALANLELRIANRL